MKRIAYLLLSILMLICCSCNAEENSTPQNGNTPDAGIRADSFYTMEGNTYNYYVNIVITSENLNVPATSLSAEIKNDTDYVIMTAVHPDICEWEKWENGKWISFFAPTVEIADREKKYGYVSIVPHGTHIRTDDFSKRPLEAGVYRLRIKYYMTNDKEILLPNNYNITYPPCIAEAYFFVAPASTE